MKLHHIVQLRRLSLPWAGGDKFMIIKQQLEMDLAHLEVMPRLNAMHNDANSRVLEISLSENGAPWQIPANVTAAVNYSKPDGTAGLYDTLPDGRSACTISGSTVTVFLAPQVLNVSGLVQASVILTKDAAQLATFPLSILVESVPGSGAEKSSDYYHYTTFDALNCAIGNLADLETGDKSSLVAAVNELANTTGSGTVKSVNGIFPDKNGDVTVDVSEAVSDALAEAKASGQFDGKDGLSIFAAHMTAGDATEILVSPNDVAANGHTVKIGDLLLTDDGRILTVKSFSMSSDLSGNAELYYKAVFVSDIGGRNRWDLLNTITLEEDSNSVIIDRDSNGNSFELSAFMFYIDRVTSESQTANATLYISQANNGSFGQLQDQSPSQTRIWMVGEFMTNHMWRSSSGSDASNGFNAHISFAGDYPTSVSMLKLYGYYFGAGTKIYFYGIRK